MAFTPQSCLQDLARIEEEAKLKLRYYFLEEDDQDAGQFVTVGEVLEKVNMIKRCWKNSIVHRQISKLRREGKIGAGVKIFKLKIDYYF